MPVVIPPGYALCSVEHWLADYPRPAVTTMGMKVLGTVDGAGNNVADQFFTAFSSAYLATMDTEVRLRNARAVVGQDGGDPLVFTSASDMAGGQSRSSTAPALALMITKNTALGGRKNRGRFYFPWAMDDNAVGQNGAVLPAIVTNFATRSANFLADLENAGGTLGLLDGAVILHSDSTPPTPITSLVPNPTIRTQRNRQARY